MESSCKNKSDKDATKALIENKIDVIATDHAPHTIKRKTTIFKLPIWWSISTACFKRYARAC